MAPCEPLPCALHPIARMETILVGVDLTDGWRLISVHTVKVEVGGNMQLSKVLGMVIVAAVVAGVIASLPDIKRYIRISTM